MLEFFRTFQKQPPEVFYTKAANFLQACNFIKKRLEHSCFPVNIAKMLRTAILKNICQRLLQTIVTRNNSLEIQAVKLRFLLIYEILLKSIATARSECTAKQENKASYNTYYIVPDLIDFFGDD